MQTEHSMQTQWKPWHVVVLGICATIVLLAILGSMMAPTLDPGSVSHAQAEPTGEATPKIEGVSAKDLIAMYKSNEVAASLKYQHQVINVYGVVDGITKDRDGDITVALDTDSWFTSLNCYFGGFAAEEVATLTKGRGAWIRGIVGEFRSSELPLTGCGVVANK